MFYIKNKVFLKQFRVVTNKCDAREETNDLQQKNRKWKT